MRPKFFNENETRFSVCISLSLTSSLINGYLLGLLCGVLFVCFVFHLRDFI